MAPTDSNRKALVEGAALLARARIAPAEDLIAILAEVQSIAAGFGDPELQKRAALLPTLAVEQPVLFHQELLQLERSIGSAAAEDSVPQRQSLASDLELVNEFVVEARDYLAQVEAQLLRLEQLPGDIDAIRTCFRAFHTIKGVAGFLEYATLQTVCHDVETLLDQARSGDLQITTAVIDVLFEVMDWVAAEIDRIDECAHGGPGEQPAPADDLLGRVARAAQVQAGDSAAAGSPGESSSVETGSVAETLDGGTESPAAHRKRGLGKSPASDERRLLKIDTAKLDSLVEMVGELVIAQSLVRTEAAAARSGNPRLSNNLAHLSRITGELQRAAMTMRMVPVGQLFQRVNRLTRDLSQKSGKSVEILVSGGDIELDRSIVEELADPLMHMIRNSMDHGIESSEERLRAGKSSPAQIKLLAFHRGSQIVLQVADDGRGLDANRILEKARRNGLVPANASLTDQEIYSLIFESGLSTAEKVTEISGRGVGMDVVRKQIQKLRGQIDIASERGKGTTFSLRLPLTLAIIDGLILGVGSSRFVLPITAVREIVQPSADMVSALDSESEVVVIRDQVLPLVRLNERFSLGSLDCDTSSQPLVVVEATSQTFCLAAGRLLGKQEVVIKQLGKAVEYTSTLVGGAILADGSVGFLIDPEALGRRHGKRDPHGR